MLRQITIWFLLGALIALLILPTPEEISLGQMIARRVFLPHPEPYAY